MSKTSQRDMALNRTYDLDIRPDADKIFKKLANRNKKQLWIIHKKITEIRQHPNHDYKFLHAPLEIFNRIHIDKHFVLIFKINHTKGVVEIYNFDHHDYVYKWRPKLGTP